MLENWGVDVNEIKEIEILQFCVGEIKVESRLRCQKVLFANKYKDMFFVLSDTGHMYYYKEENVVYQRRYSWVIYAQCGVPGVEEDEVTIFLVITLI